MKLSVKIPLIIGAGIVVTAVSIGFISLRISNDTLERTILGAMGDYNRANANYLSATLTGRLNVLHEIANRPINRGMDWDIIRPTLEADIARIGSLEIGLVFPDGTTHYVTDPATVNLGDRDYIIEAFSGRNSISDVLISRATGEAVVMIAAPIFQTDAPNAPVVGVMIARLHGGQALSDIVVNLSSSLPSGHSYLIARDGTISAHRNTAWVTDQFNPIVAAQTIPAERAFAELLTTAIREGDGFAYYTYGGENRIAHFTEVPGHRWMLVNTVDMRDITSQINQMRIVVLSLGLVFVIIGSIVAFFIGKTITKQIAFVTGRLKDIAEGEADLTRRINSRAKDEMGELSGYFDSTMEGFRQLIVAIKKESQTLSGIGTDLSSNMTETAAAMNEITANVQSIKGRVLNQSASVSQTHATMEQVTSNINKLNGHVESQSSHISQASAAIEQMVANVQSVTDTLMKNAANVQSLSEASDIGRAGLQDVAADIQGIARESEGLMEINAVMENIASQTNLLSMNAAIEAAHAGEAGRGFAVVADEIRKLAESSSEQSKTIGTVLKKIKDSIELITRSTENVLSKFEAIDTNIRTVAELETAIRNSMEEQRTGSAQILEGVSRVTDITQQVRSGTTEMLEGAREVIVESTNLEKATQEITAGMNEMASGAEQVNVAVSQVNDISNKNRSGIDTLIKEVSRFKV